MAKQENTAAAVAYIFSILSGVIVYLTQKGEYERFHAVQSILLGIAILVLYFPFLIVSVILAIIPGIGVLGSLLMLIYWLGTIIIALFLAWKAYNGEKYKLPLIGKYAEKYA